MSHRVDTYQRALDFIAVACGMRTDTEVRQMVEAVARKVYHHDGPGIHLLRRRIASAIAYNRQYQGEALCWWWITRVREPVA